MFQILKTELIGSDSKGDIVEKAESRNIGCANADFDKRVLDHQIVQVDGKCLGATRYVVIIE